jgi:hypothetical protein
MAQRSVEALPAHDEPSAASRELQEQSVGETPQDRRTQYSVKTNAIHSEDPTLCSTLRTDGGKGAVG